MCQVDQDDDENFQLVSEKPAISKKCQNCPESACVVIRMSDPMCRKCFEEFFVHKFRSSISKSNVFTKGERVLIAFSGGPSSVALLHLIADGLSVNARRRLQFRAQVAFIDESILFPEETNENVEKIVEFVRSKDNYPLEIVRLEKKFAEIVEKTKSLTAREELIRREKLGILFDLAIRERCTKLITGDNCTKLASQILSDMAQGRGGHVALECNLVDERDERVTIVRPFREVTSKEIAIFNRLNGLESICTRDISTMAGPQSSIFKLTESLVNDLQRQFPSTVSTIFRTSDKLEKKVENRRRCDLCRCVLDVDQAVPFELEKLDFIRDSFDFPSDRDLEFCYGCRRTLRDVQVR